LNLNLIGNKRIVGWGFCPNKDISKVPQDIYLPIEMTVPVGTGTLSTNSRINLEIFLKNRYNQEGRDYKVAFAKVNKDYAV